MRRVVDEFFPSAEAEITVLLCCCAVVFYFFGVREHRVSLLSHSGHYVAPNAALMLLLYCSAPVAQQDRAAVS